MKDVQIFNQFNKLEKMKTIFLNYGTTKEIEKAEKQVFKLYDKYKFVKMEMHGINQIKIIAKN